MTYDSVSWHTDGGPGAPAPDVAGRHIAAVLDWLARHNLLSDLGRELQELPLSEDTSLTDDMLTALGRRILDAHYAEWARSITYDAPPPLDVFDHALSEQSPDVPPGASPRRA